MTDRFIVLKIIGVHVLISLILVEGDFKNSHPRGLKHLGNKFQKHFLIEFHTLKHCWVIKQSPESDQGGTNYYEYILMFYLCCTQILGNFSFLYKLGLGLLVEFYVLYVMHHDQFISVPFFDPSFVYSSLIYQLRRLQLCRPYHCNTDRCFYHFSPVLY